MNYIELCQTVRSDASIQGEGPTSVLGQIGIYAKIVRWVQEAYIEIQSFAHDYDWMRAELELPVTAGLGKYDLLSGASWNRPDVRRFMDNNSWLQATSTGNRTRVRVVTHERMLRDYPNVSSTGTPTLVTIRPNRMVEFNTVPIENATWKVEAKLTPEKLTAGDHIPMMPEQHHDCIVRLALMKYYTHDGDREGWAEARAQYNGALARLIMETVPAIERTVSRGEDN